MNNHHLYSTQLLLIFVSMLLFVACQEDLATEETDIADDQTDITDKDMI